VIDDPAEVDKLLKGAYDRGLNTWDTANVYSNGVSESLIGDTIKKHKIPRHKLILLSKCNGIVGEEPGVVHVKYPNEIKSSKDYVNQGGLSRAAIFNAVDASLERLGTTYLDLLQIHRFDKTVPIEETMKALHDLVQNGKVRYIGKDFQVDILFLFFSIFPPHFIRSFPLFCPCFPPFPSFRPVSLFPLFSP
jgi:aryl-alcohol dehydrogenase-like predicted oxidoreductase